MRFKVKPEDTIHIIASVGTAETDLVPYGGTSSQVPTTKYARIIYGAVLNNEASSANTLTIRIYASDGTTLEKEIKFALGAYDTVDINRDLNSPILVVPGGKYIKAVATAASVNVILNAYDV